MPMIRGRLRRRRGYGDDTAENAGEEFVEIDPAELSGVFSAPGWLRDAGLTAWLLVGVALLVVAVIALLSLTSVIVLPVIVAGIIAAVASPLVGWLNDHHIPRGLGATLLMVRTWVELS